MVGNQEISVLASSNACPVASPRPEAGAAFPLALAIPPD
jgi:hypothetical protein